MDSTDVGNDRSYVTSTSSKKYLECERTLLAELYRERKEILLRKDRDLKTSVLKTQAWEEITERYNASKIIQGQRTSAQLRKLWENMVRLTRESITKQKQQVQKQTPCNDGSTTTTTIVLETPCRSIFEEVADILGHEDVNCAINGHAEICDVRIHEMDAPCASYNVDSDIGSAPRSINSHIPLPPTSSSSQLTPPMHITKQLLNKRIKRFRKPGFFYKQIDRDEEIYEMRRKEHEMKKSQHELTMTKLEWEVAYWRRKYETEFGD